MDHRLNILKIMGFIVCEHHIQEEPVLILFKDYLKSCSIYRYSCEHNTGISSSYSIYRLFEILFYL